MANINYQSDFQVEVGLKGKNIEGVPFTLTFYTAVGDATFEADYDGSNYTNCKKLDDRTILVTFNSHELRPGQLKVKKQFHVSDMSYPDGVHTIVDVEALDIFLTTGRTDAVDPIKATIYQTFLKPVKGIDYFTPAERTEFRNGIIQQLKEDGELRSQVFNELKGDAVFFNDVVKTAEDNLKSDEVFINAIVQKVYDSGIKTSIENNVKSAVLNSQAFVNEVVDKVMQKI